MMQDNTPINFYIKHFFINCQIKKLQSIFDTIVSPCICTKSRLVCHAICTGYRVIQVLPPAR
jgi:hypothetical protein